MTTINNQNINNEEDWLNLADLATSLFATEKIDATSSIIKEDNYSVVTKRKTFSKEGIANQAKHVLVNSEGVPISENLWKLIINNYLKIINNVNNLNKRCGGCGGYHVQSHRTLEDIKKKTNIAVINLFMVCKTFNKFSFLRKRYCPISFNIPLNNLMKSHRPYALYDIPMITNAYFLGRIKTRTGHGNHNRIYGYALANLDTKIYVKWEDRKFPLYFFTRLDYLVTSEGKLHPQLRIPCYKLVNPNNHWGMRENVKSINISYKWTTELVSKEQLPSRKWRYTVLVLGSPWNLEEKKRGASILNFKKQQPISKMKARNICYLVYLLKDNWCYQIVPKNVIIGTLPENRGIQFQSGIM